MEAEPLNLRLAYAPLESQFKFHESKARFKGFSGPIGSGKSAALCQEVVRLAYANQGRTGLLGAPTYAMLRDATLPALFRVMADAEVEYEHNKSEGVVTIPHLHSTILLRSLDEPERLRGTNLAWFAVDELTYVSEEAWIRLEGRLRDPEAEELCGFAVWTPRGFDWVWRRFINEPIDGYEVVQAKPFENKHMLARTPDFYERLKKSYDPEFYAQEVLGEYVSTRAGRVYKQFERGRNVEEMEADPGTPLLWALDFNVDPMSSVVVQMCGGEVRVLDEIVIRRAGTRDACEEFARRYPEAPAGLRVYADASAHRETTAGWSDREILQDCLAGFGYRNVEFLIPRGNPPVRRRVEVVNAKLYNALGDVGMRVDPRCAGLIKDFENVVWVEGTNEIDKESDSRLTHLSDALGYLVWEEFHRELRTVGYRPGRLLR
jgi:hypothetical protein